MEDKKVALKDLDIKEYNAIIIGSGAAGLNCALHLIMEGIPSDDVAIVTDNLGGGTSFNAGSDKQTYYKMSIYGDQTDSPYNLAKDLYSGGAMHGDIALIEATNSIREFFHLVQLGVPFPYDKFGGFVGYKTDNDPRQRATSIGPLTSREMGKRLLKAVQGNSIKIYDKFYAIKLIIDDSSEKPEVCGVICINTDLLSQGKSLKNFSDSIQIFKARNIIIATGGPAILYKNSVYPKSQTGTTSLVIEAGCKLQNLTESQFGIASTKFRWNLSGSYQQVIPRYFSRDETGIEREFLYEIFPSFKELSRAIFLKGYQWSFNSIRIDNFGSSLIDLAVYHESEKLNRHVFLDFTQNPKDYNYNDLFKGAKEYLIKSNALGDSPIERLSKLNDQAILIYKNNNINLASEPLEIAVCNQHLNGGVSCDIWWETTTVKHLFAVGEINGSHGIYRPGGAALNSGQVGGLRAAQKIIQIYSNIPSINPSRFQHKVKKEITEILSRISQILKNDPSKSENFLTPERLLSQIQNGMTKYGSIIRPLKNLKKAISKVQFQLDNIKNLLAINTNIEIVDFFRVRDALVTQLFFLKTLLDYHLSFGRSRGSYLILRDNLNESLSEFYIVPPDKLKEYKFIHNNMNLSKKIQTIQLKNGQIFIEWEDIRDVPTEFGWFENIWKEFYKNK
ncbi:MAG: FAD-binding protein [Promethearchaeota archaeon]